MESNPSSEVERDLSDEHFFRGLIAALKLNGVDFIATRDDEHHKRFARVVQHLGANADDPHYQVFPRSFFPSPVTGIYPQLDQALIVDLQFSGLTCPNGPFFLTTKLELPIELAEKILGTFSPDTRRVFDALATVFSSDN